MRLRLKLIGLILSILLLLPIGSVAADSLTNSDLQSIINQTPFYDPNSLACSSGATSTVTPGSGSPQGVTFPNLDPTAMANAINAWITQQNPKSELSGLGTTIVASAKNSNINPFLIVSIAHEESSLSDPGDYNVSHGNNSFGRAAAAGQPSFQGSRLWYKWSSVKASVDYTAPENKGAVGGGDIASYIRNQYASELDKNDLVAFMEAYAPPKDSNNTAQYIANLNSWISSLIGLTTGGTTKTTPANTGGGGSGCVSVTTASCGTPTTTSGQSQVRQNVVCIAQQELNTWQSQPGYPWNGSNNYSATGYLKYSQGRQEEWCADFTSWVFDQAKYPLQPDPSWNIASVAGIQAVGQEEQNFHWHPESSYTPKPGDIAIHGGGHVNIVISVKGSTVNLIGGDQGSGPYPGGSIVSTEVASSFNGSGITGYVSPD